MTEPDPLAEHLDMVRRSGRLMAIMLGIVLFIYAAAVVLSGWKLGVVVVGGIVILIGIGLAYRIHWMDIQETDRLMDEGLEILREDKE